MVASTGLHWFRFSTPKKADDVIETWGAAAWGNLLPGRFNQTSKRVDAQTGIEVHYGSAHAGQPVVVEMAGEACERVGWQRAAQFCEAACGRVTRADLATDVEPASEARARLKRMKGQFKRGKCDTQFRSHAWHESDEGNTLYVGSRSSAIFLRVYDRRGPLRIEFEIKPDSVFRGREFGRSLLAAGPAALWRLYAQRCMWPESWYRELLVGDLAAAERVQSTTTDLDRAMDALRASYGATLWAFKCAGVSLDALAVSPDEDGGDGFPRGLNSNQFQKFLAWSFDADAMGLDGAGLRRQLEMYRDAEMREKRGYELTDELPI